MKTCPKCGGELTEIIGHLDDEMKLETVTATCAKCGEVELNGWKLEDFL